MNYNSKFIPYNTYDIYYQYIIKTELFNKIYVNCIMKQYTIYATKYKNL